LKMEQPKKDKREINLIYTISNNSSIPEVKLPFLNYSLLFIIFHNVNKKSFFPV